MMKKFIDSNRDEKTFHLPHKKSVQPERDAKT